MLLVALLSCLRVLVSLMIGWLVIVVFGVCGFSVGFVFDGCFVCGLFCLCVM